MKIEHVALNVSRPLELARWYVEHLGLTVKRRTVDAPYAHFLADDSGTVMLEIYGNDSVPVPDYAAMNPMSLHFAFVSANIDDDVARLERAGAKLIGEIQHQPNGDTMALLRDPWGVTLQLVKRKEPMI